MTLVISGAAKLAERRARMSLTPRQLFIGLHRAGFITPEEAEAAATTGAVPAALEAAIAGLEPADRADVVITWARMTVAERTNPLVALLAAQVGASDAEIDAFFETFVNA